MVHNKLILKDVLYAKIDRGMIRSQITIDEFRIVGNTIKCRKDSGSRSSILRVHELYNITFVGHVFIPTRGSAASLCSVQTDGHVRILFYNNTGNGARGILTHAPAKQVNGRMFVYPSIHCSDITRQVRAVSYF